MVGMKLWVIVMYRVSIIKILWVRINVKLRFRLWVSFCYS